MLKTLDVIIEKTIWTVSYGFGFIIGFCEGFVKAIKNRES